MGEWVPYRVIDACEDSTTNKVFIYVRNANKGRQVISLDAHYELVVGACDRDRLRSLEALSNSLSNVFDTRVSITLLNECDTYYRSRVPLLTIRCANHSVYAKVQRSMKYRYTPDYFLCNSCTTVENRTLIEHGIYGCEYICHNGDRVRPAEQLERFEYVPKVAGIDLEMLSLNPIDPSFELYMGSYYSDERTVVIYTKKYYDGPVLDNGTVYIPVETKQDIAICLANVIAAESPDIVTGYNIYNADMPLLYYALGLCMLKWPRMCTGAEPFFQYTRKLDKRFVESEAGTVIKIPGCHVIDMYFHLENILPSEEKNSLKLDDVSERYLGEKKDPFSHGELGRIYHKGTREERLSVMHYCIRDSYLCVALYNKFNVWNYHSGIYSVSGVDPQRSVCTGEVDITYGMCYKKCKDINMFMDDPNNRIFSPSGGMVLQTKRGMYNNVYCLDFTSMYPNIAIEHNIDASSVIRAPLDSVGTLHREYYYGITQDRKTVALKDSKNRTVLFDLTKRGVLPSVLEKLLEERAAIKKKLSTATELEKLQLSGQEQARKIGANGACGALGQQTPGNPMSFCTLNDVITTTGQMVLSTAENIATQMGLTVLYGDTDSLFVHSRSGNVDEYLSQVHKMLPGRIRFKIEYIADKFIVGSKKHYIARINGKVKIMGYKAVKSSSCKAAQTLFRWLIDVLLDCGPQQTEMCYRDALATYSNPMYNIDPEMFVSRFSYNGKMYAEGTYRDNVVKSMLGRNIELIPGNSLTVTTVKTMSEYVSMYGKDPPIKLPNSKAKSERLYTLEEVSACPQVIDVVEVLNVQCGSDLVSILSALSVF
jgi:DNA polymerase elongation subunit (family B)